MFNKSYQKFNHAGREFSVLALPGSNFFKFEIISDIGSDIEKLYGEKVDRNVYGMAHLIEHLGFRATKDFTTEDLMTALKRNGEYNASTNHDEINYFYKTINTYWRAAVLLTCNFALNDLKKIPENEFLIERGVVYNEAKRYADDDQTMFHFKVSPTILGRHPEDTIIGEPATIETFTLQDCQNMKAIILKNNKPTFNITYDPQYVTLDTILEEVTRELDRYAPPKELEVDISYEEYVQSRDTSNLEVTNHFIENASEQRMVSLVFDVINGDGDDSITDWVNSYISQYATGISLSDYIREKNGLTYGLHFYTAEYGTKKFVQFSCDVTRGQEDFLIELFVKSINECYETWDDQKFFEYKETKALKTGLYLVNLGGYGFVHNIGRKNPEVYRKYSAEFMQNIDQAWDLIVDQEFTFPNMRSYMKCLADTVNCGKFAVITN